MAEERWELCPSCHDGFPSYLGLSKDGKTHRYACTWQECERYYSVPVGKGEFDRRLGMELSDSVVYYDKCDGCRKSRPVKLDGLRFFCFNCTQDKDGR